jgi:hypothetical protein
LETIKIWFSLGAGSIKTSYPGCSRIADTHGGLVNIEFSEDISLLTLAKIKLTLDHQVWHFALTKSQRPTFFRTEWHTQIGRQDPVKAPEPALVATEVPTKITTWAERVANGNISPARPSPHPQPKLAPVKESKSQPLQVNKIDDNREDSNSYTVEPRGPIEDAS